MNKVKIALVSLGHYIYFEQFPGLKEELIEKGEEFKQYIDTTACEAGPTHHLALGVGHYMNTLRKFSRISGIELVEVK